MSEGLDIERVAGHYVDLDILDPEAPASRAFLIDEELEPEEADAVLATMRRWEREEAVARVPYTLRDPTLTDEAKLLYLAISGFEPPVGFQDTRIVLSDSAKLLGVVMHIHKEDPQPSEMLAHNLGWSVGEVHEVMGEALSALRASRLR